MLSIPLRKRPFRIIIFREIPGHSGDLNIKPHNSFFFLYQFPNYYIKSNIGIVLCIFFLDEDDNDGSLGKFIKIYFDFFLIFSLLWILKRLIIIPNKSCRIDNKKFKFCSIFTCSYYCRAGSPDFLTLKKNLHILIK